MRNLNWRIIVARTLFYQVFVFVCLCVFSFTAAPGWWGVKAMVAEMSIRNIFFPVSFEEACPKLKKYAEWRMAAIHNYPDEFKVIDHAFLAEEFYWCKYQYKDKKGNKIVEIDHFRVRWKPWEYYYEYNSVDDAISNYDELQESQESISSKESKRAWNIRQEWLRKQRERALEDITKVA